MALWPPLAALAIYLAVAVSLWWSAVLTVPALVAWQWISLRRQANDALITAIAGRGELSRLLSEAVQQELDTRRGEEDFEQEPADDVPLEAAGQFDIEEVSRGPGPKKE
jgi:hypothetical protein